MILPQKHIKLSESIFGLGGIVLQLINKPISVDDLWNKFENIINSDDFPSSCNFDKFILVLDYLYIIGAIKQDNRGNIILCD